MNYKIHACKLNKEEVLNFNINKQYSTKAFIDDPLIEGVYTDENDEYIVEKHRIIDGHPFGYRLAIKRTDGKPIHSWSLFQDIKNQVAGDEVVAIEIYPEKSKVTNTTNMYHLWVFEPGYRPIIDLIPPK